VRYTIIPPAVQQPDVSAVQPVAHMTMLPLAAFPKPIPLKEPLPVPEI
jgi:hypothetical protein